MSVILKRIISEVQGLLSSPLDDVRIRINEDDIADVVAFVRGPEDTPFEGGVFKIRLVLNEDFPNVPPKGFFITKIFHPNVSAKGEICVNTLKKDWNPNLGIKHILLAIRCLLICPNPESALNEEAGKLLLEDYESYKSHASLMTSIHASRIKWCDIAPPNDRNSKLNSKAQENDVSMINKEKTNSPSKKVISTAVQRSSLRRL